MRDICSNMILVLNPMSIHVDRCTTLVQVLMKMSGVLDDGQN